MKVVISNKLSPRNVNLAYIEGTKVKSDDVLQIKDTSLQYTENLLPIFTEDRICTAESDGTLNITNDTLTSQITSEYNYIKESAEYIPLWLKYRLKGVHFNNTAQFKTVFYTVSTLADYQYISPKSKSIVAINTINVEYKVGDNWVDVNTSHYIIDSGKKNVIFKTANLAFYLGKDIRISYYLVNYALLIYDDIGNEMDTTYFRVDIRKHETSPGDAEGNFQESDTPFMNNIYEATLLFANIFDEDKTYFIEYTEYSVLTGTTNTKTEVINPSPLYSKVLELETFHIKDSYVFTIDDTTMDIGTKLPEEWPIIFVKYPRNRNSKIAALEPHNIPHDLPWFIEISNDKFTRTVDSNTYTYRPIERLSQNVINDSYTIKSSKEDIKKIDEFTIKTNYNDLFVTHNNNGIPTNITIYNSDTDISDAIDWIDNARGLIKLTRSININQANNYIEYQYKIFNIQYQGANLNPYMVFNHTNNNVIDKFIIIYMMPLEELIPSKGKSLFHATVYKYPERYEDVEDWQKGIDIATEYIEGNSDGQGTILLTDLPPSGTTFYFGEITEEYVEGYNKFTEGSSWEIYTGVSGVMETAASISDGISTSELGIYSATDYRYADVASGEVTIYKSGDNQNVWFDTPSGEVSTMITTEDITGSRSNLYDLIGDYLSPDIPDESSLHPVILGYINSTNITTPEGLTFRDVRRRGGGIPVNQQVNELFDNEIRHHLDIAKINGYDYNLSNIAIVNIKKAVKTRLQGLLLRYDPYVQRQSRDNANFSIDAYSETYIESVVRKYLNAACHITIKYI